MLEVGTGLYLGLLMLLCLVCAVLVMRSGITSAVNVTADFKAFQRKFLIVYLLVFLADWLQGPYVYALYASYGYSKGKIAILFIAGFGASMLVGTIVGGLADRFGRRLNCLLFCVLYSLSCATKHSTNFSLLLAGRILGGVSTSILYSAFESWMVHEHNKNGCPQPWLSHTFGIMTFSNGVVAIVAGMIASPLAANFGYVAPFDLSLAILVIAGVVIFFTWTENYGDKFSTGFSNFSSAWNVLLTNEKVMLLGIIQSSFEAAMYLFVFQWTPWLEDSAPADVNLPHGLIFSSFMVCLMIGSKIFEALVASRSVENLARYAFLLAACSLLVPIVTTHHLVCLLAFCVFELCVGVYFPSVGTMRGKYVPAEVRSTLVNFFRIGLNLIVVLVLANTDRMSAASSFSLCCLLLLIATLAQQRLFALTAGNLSAEERAKENLQPGDEPIEGLESKEDAQA